MTLKIMAALRLVADAASWFDSLSAEQQKEYLELHPNSKYADDAKTGEEPVKPGKKPYVPHNSKNRVKHKKVSIKEVHEFAHSEHAAAGSKPRRTLGQMIKAKAIGIVKHLKDEVKEAGVAGHAVTKLLRGKKTTPEEQHAMKATATRLVIVIGSLAVGGGLAAAFGEGLKAVAEEIAKDFMAHGVINATEKTLMHSAVASGDDSDAGLDKMTELMSDYMANSPNVQKILQSIS